MSSFDAMFGNSSDWTPASSGGRAAGGYGGLSTAGTFLQVGGMLTSAIGRFYEVQSSRYGARSAALRADLEASFADMGARDAEEEAQQLLVEGRERAGERGLQGAQEKGAYRASAAAHGIQLGVGSTAETAATIDYAKESDVLAIRVGAQRAAGAARMAAVDLRTRAKFSRLSAENLRGAARLMNPWVSAGMSLFGSAAQVAPQWIYEDKRGAY